MLSPNHINMEELKEYLKNNLSIDIDYGLFDKSIVLKLEGQPISKVKMPIF